MRRSSCPRKALPLIACSTDVSGKFLRRKTGVTAAKACVDAFGGDQTKLQECDTAGDLAKIQAVLTLNAKDPFCEEVTTQCVATEGDGADNGLSAENAAVIAKCRPPVDYLAVNAGCKDSFAAAKPSGDAADATKCDAYEKACPNLPDDILTVKDNETVAAAYLYVDLPVDDIKAVKKACAALKSGEPEPKKGDETKVEPKKGDGPKTGYKLPEDDKEYQSALDTIKKNDPKTTMTIADLKHKVQAKTPKSDDDFKAALAAVIADSKPAGPSPGPSTSTSTTTSTTTSEGSCS